MNQIKTQIIQFNPTIKQDLAWKHWNDKTHTEILFGGGAGGGKSLLECFCLISSADAYPKSRWFMGRKELKLLRQSTLQTFFDLCNNFGLQNGFDYKFDAKDNVIRWYNGSDIYLLDLRDEPSDPNFDRLGSTEYTGGVIDECNQISSKAKTVLSSRIRYKLDEFGVIPKMMMTCNPAKNWVYYDFYKPASEGKLEPYKSFIQALVTDNPHISKHYIENLKKMDKVNRERLLNGNWEYDDDPARLFDYNVILDLFTNQAKKSTERFIICDVARDGDDKTSVSVWEGLKCIRIITLDKSSITQVVSLIKQLEGHYQVRRSHVCVDEDGVGGGVVDGLPGCRGFLNNAKPVQPLDASLDDTKKLNYPNLKTQCWFKFADLAGTGKIQIQIEDPEIKEMIVEELEQIKRDMKDLDGKLKLIPKKQIKEVLGRSPDIADSLMMRMYYEIKPATNLFSATFIA